MGITLDAYFRRGELLVWWALQLFPSFRELSFRNLRVWRWNFRVKWIFTERVSWVGILKEKSERGEISKKIIRRALADPQPISPTGNSTYYPRTGTSLILCHMVVIEMSKISAIFLNRSKYRVCERLGLVGNIGKFPKKSIKISCLSQKYCRNFQHFNHYHMT